MAARAIASEKKLMGPGAFKHRGALGFAYSEDVLDLYQLSLETALRLAFALRSRNDGQIVGDAGNGLAAAVVNLRRDPALRQDHLHMPGGVILLTKV
jgi:hypothetical protein